MYGLGIDLGTTASAVAAWHAGRAEVVPLAGAESCPSVVFLAADGIVEVGAAADRAAATTPDRAVRGFKRRFGDDVPYLLAGRELTAEDLTGWLLGWVLDGAVAAHDGEPPAVVMLTVPATWQDYRLDCLLRTARAAAPGLVTSTLPEPAAAAVFYAGRDQVTAGTTVGVYDFGGGTVDATLLRKTAGGFEILGLPLGDEQVGGLDVDEALLRLVGVQLGSAWAALDRQDPTVRRGLARLRWQIVAAKEELSARTEVEVDVDLPGLRRTVTVSRTRLEEAIDPLVERSVDVLADVIDAAGLTPADLDRVLLVGGSSRIPLVARRVDERLGIRVVTDAHPKYAVCLGAAVAAGSLLSMTSSAPDVVHAGRPPEAQVGLAPKVPIMGAPPPTHALEVDLASQGLLEAARVPVRPAAELRRRAPDPADTPLTADLTQDDAYRVAARRALVLVALVVATLAMLAVLLARR